MQRHGSKHLRSQQHSSRANQLQLSSQHRHWGQETVNVVHGQIQCLVLKLVLLANLNEPVHQDGPHAVCDVRLLLHVPSFWFALHLLTSATLQAFSWEFGDCQTIKGLLGWRHPLRNSRKVCSPPFPSDVCVFLQHTQRLHLHRVASLLQQQTCP